MLNDVFFELIISERLLMQFNLLSFTDAKVSLIPDDEGLNYPFYMQ
jgi:hypothetical protein